MNMNFKAGKQDGFTLIELIVVIVILGILAATALPKFADLGADARLASLKAAKGAVSAASAMVHAKAIVAGSDAEVTVEGVKVALTNRYPTAADALAEAAGLNKTDYDYSAANGVLTVKVVGASKPENCAFTYKNAAVNEAPVIADVTTLDCE